MQWNDLVRRVRTLGQYTTDAEAVRVLRAVLPLLGSQVPGAERRELAERLPREAAVLLAVERAARPLTAREFVDAAAERLGGVAPAPARWDVGSVLAVLGEDTGGGGDDLGDRLLATLPRGYALLFGRAELTAAA
ncbi:DUF2267 domain-containing protein [Streptomyces sp. NPDC054784]